MTACTSPELIVRSTPLTIGVPSSRATCRFFNSSVAKIRCSSVLDGKAQTGLARDAHGTRTLFGEPRRSASRRGKGKPEKRWYAGHMPNISAPEIILLLIVALLLFGAKRLPEIGRSLGSGMREFKDSVSGNSKPEPTQMTQLPVSTTEP